MVTIRSTDIGTVNRAQRNPLAPHEESGSREANATIHLFASNGSDYLFVADRSRIYGISETVATRLQTILSYGSDEQLSLTLEDLGLAADDSGMADVPVDPTLRTLSLAISSTCNMACTYCYADGGSFAAPTTSMTAATAIKAADLLIGGAVPGERVRLVFLGGEPLANRAVIREVTETAAQRAAERGVRLEFSITTNGTLITNEDADLFERHGFAVTVSIDGSRTAHDGQRPLKNGSGTFDRIIERIRPLLEPGRKLHVSARATVTARNAGLRESLDTLIGVGFHSVGFSPMLRSPNGRDELTHADMDNLLSEMIECGQEFERKMRAREPYPFQNLESALAQLHRGTHRPYPCGAGAGYMAASAKGELYACHRFVNDAAAHMGDLDHAVDRAAQTSWLNSRHVHRQSPCTECWARYLCGGGCHHEVMARGRPACNYIRGWLDYCLGVYIRTLNTQPEYFSRR